MSLFDVIDDVAQRQTLKSTMGDNRIFGTVIGTVTNNYNMCSDTTKRSGCECTPMGTDCDALCR